MDISKITSSLLQGLEQKQTEQLQALSRVLNLVIGKSQVATVLATQPVSKAEREALLKQTTEALDRLQKQPAPNSTASPVTSPAIKAEIARLTQQQQLLQSPNLKWIDLGVNNRQLTTYSDRPLTPGQPLLVQLQSPQKLVLVDEFPAEDVLKATTTALQTAAALKAGVVTANPVTGAATGAASATLTQASQVASTVVKNPAPPPSNVPSSPAPSQSAPAVSPPPAAAALADILEPTSQEGQALKQDGARSTFAANAQELAKKFVGQTQAFRQERTHQPAALVVTENLRRLLPQKDVPEQLFAAIQQLQLMPTAKRQQLLPVTVEQALKSLAMRLRTPAQLSEPRQLAQAIKDSGVFFERKLQQLAKPIKSSQAEHEAPQLKEDAKPARHETKMSPQALITRDAKGALLNLLDKITRELTGKPLTSEQTYKLMQQPLTPQHAGGAAVPGQKSELAQALAAFIREMMNKPAKTGSGKEQRTQLLTLLQQQTQHSLAKIQLQQLQAVHQELESKDAGSPTSSWQLEIPLRHQSDVQQLQLQITREWVEEKHQGEAARAGSAKVRQWSVTLRFDLPTLGEFCAQLAVMGEQVNATLWASREQTFEQARQQLDSLRQQLEEEGIEVKNLQCLLGMPPPKPLALSYSLIDIST